MVSKKKFLTLLFIIISTKQDLKIYKEHTWGRLRFGWLGIRSGGAPYILIYIATLNSYFSIKKHIYLYFFFV